MLRFMSNDFPSCISNTVCHVIFLCCCRVSFADPVAVRHSLEILSELATSDPYAVAMALGK